MNACNNLPDFSNKLVQRRIFGYQIKFTNLRQLTVSEHLQTIFFVIYVIVFYISLLHIPTILILFTNLAPRLRYVYILYLCWMIYDRRRIDKEGKKWRWIKRLAIFRYYRDYFPIRLVKTAELTPDKNYLLVMYPHGVVPFSVVTNFGTYVNNVDKLYPHIELNFVTLTFMFWTPIIREYFLALGGRGASDASMVYYLNGKPSKGLLVVPGGANDSLYSRPGSDYTIRKKQRKGFVRVALKTGASLVPVFSFGENNALGTVSSSSGWLRFLLDGVYKYTGIRAVLLDGAGIFQQSFGIMPKRVPITTVVGKPIAVPKVENPSAELIDEYLEKFFEALKDLFEEYKHICDSSGSKATITIA